MGKGISIGIGADTKTAITAIKSGLIDPLQDSQDALEKLNKSGNLDDIERGMKADQKATELFNRELQDAQNQIKKVASTSKSSTREVSDDFELSAREQTKLRKEAISEIGNEAKANAAETFSSFDGSAQSFVDGIQGTLGGLVSSLGPIGLAAGAAGALAIGLINGALQNADTTSQEFKQSVSDMTTELIKSGQVGKVSVGYIVSELQKLATESDSSKVSLTKLDDIAKKSKTSYKDLAQAYAGNEGGLRDLVDAGKAKLDVDERQAESLSKLSVEQKKAAGIDGDAEAAALRRGEAQKQVNSYLEQASTKAADAAKQQELYAKAGGPDLERKAALISQIDTAYDEAAGSVDNFVNKETGVFDVAKYIASMQARSQALLDYQKTLQTSGLSKSAITFLNSQGEEAAATLLSGYKSGSKAQQDVLNQIWSEAGKSNSGQYTSKLKDGLPKHVDGPKVDISADTSAATKAISNLGKKTIRVPVELVTRNGQVIK